LPTKTSVMTKTQLRILEVAKKQFSRYGYDRVSIDDLGAAIGVSGPSLYRHFSSKIEILVALMDHVLEGLTQAANEVTHTDGPALARLRMLVLLHVRFVLSDPHYIHIYHREIDRLPPKFHKQHDAKSDKYHELWHELLTEIDPALTPEQRTVAINAAIGVVNFTAFRQRYPLPPEDLLFECALAAVLAPCKVAPEELPQAGQAPSAG
jgi:AcrR family transcriptional regulator